MICKAIKMRYNNTGDYMKIFTSGYELTTSITNIFIFVVSLFGYIKIHNKPWKTFYLLMTIDSFLGVIVHGLVMSKTVNDLLWVLLSILFTITVNMLLHIFINIKMKHVIMLSILLSVIMLTQLFLGMDFLLTFVIYIMLVFAISVYFIIKKNYKNKKLLLLGFGVQLIGGILLLCKTTISILNYNCICHLFTVATLIIFYIAIQKKD